MRKPLLVALAVLATAAVLLLTVKSSALTDEFGLNKDKGREGSMSENRVFSVAGMYTGTIDRSIDIAGRTMRVADDVFIWVVGQGRGNRGMFVTDRALYASVEVKDGVPTVRQILIRPSESTQRATPVSPASKAKRVPSSTDAKVGELVADVAK
jgi:hypothetical protein